MYYGALNGVDLENLVLQRYRGTLKKNEKWTKILNYKSTATKSYEGISPLYREREAKCCGNGSWWWEPPKESIPKDFCLESSMHGLRFIAQSKRHLSERIFWAVVFLSSVIAATLLINDVWTRYYANPVIVSFTPQEVDIDDLPFPAVTICNMNKFPRSGLEERLKIVRNAKNGSNPTEEEVLAREEIKMINAACTSQRSFAKLNHFAYNRGRIDPNLTSDEMTEESKIEMVEFLLANTLSCDKMMRYCMWSEKEVDCNLFFKGIVTDYGKCCAFNLLPEKLLLTHRLRNPNSKRRKGNYTARWPDEEADEWRKWDYVNDGFLLKKNVKQPMRQSRAGLQHGLSILIDPAVDNSFCPISDSEGVRIMLHTSLEVPHVHDLGTIIGLGQEVFVEIHPELTTADDDIKSFDLKDRKCLFSDEHKLDFYKPYTSSNCMDECSSKILLERCNCSSYYTPKAPGAKTCNSDYRSEDFTCIEKEKEKMVADLKTECEHCLSSCEDIAYNMEVTVSDLHHADTLWKDHANKTNVAWANNKIGIVHLYLGVDSVVPKIRQRLYGTTDLIANTGGLLGLCLGFSVMSLIEVVYFITLRAFWQYRKKKESVMRIANRFIDYVWKSRNNHTNRVGFDVERNHAALNPAYTNSYGFTRNPTNNYPIYNNFRF